MRIRIIRAETEEIDGIDLGSMKLGAIYDLPTSLATYLILNGAGEPADLRAIDDEERIAMNVQTWREIAASSSGGPFRKRRSVATKRKDG